MRYFKDLVNDLLMLFGIELAPWMAPLVAVLIVLAVLPFYARNFRTKQARKRILAASHAGGEERARLQQEALDLAAGNPFGLIVVAEEAERKGMMDLARRATVELGRTGKRRTEYRRLLERLSQEKPSSPEMEAAAVERLRDQGLDSMATERLRKALEKWPGSPVLEELLREERT